MRRWIPWALIALCYLAVPPLFAGSDFVMSQVIASLTIAGVALAWALLGNLGGMVSFGHAAFFGVGAYVAALLAKGWGVNPFLGLAAGGFGAAVASLVTMPALRLRGPYFALAILAYAQIFRILANELTSVTGGAAGVLSIPALPPFFGFTGKTGAYFTIVTILLLALLAYKVIRGSYWGLALKAMHDTEDATRVLGVPSSLLKAAMLAVSAFITGVVGAYNAHVIGFLEPNYAFSSLWTVLPIVAAMVGGYRTLAGPIVGAPLIYLLDQLVFKNILPQGHQIMFGILLGAMILFSPSGLLPLLAKPFRSGVSLSREIPKGKDNATSA